MTRRVQRLTTRTIPERVLLMTYRKLNPKLQHALATWAVLLERLSPTPAKRKAAR
jgi:hypothetical protein